MKKVILICIFSCFLFTACETSDTEDVSEITNYAVITVKGPEEVLQPMGEDFVDPGVSAEEAGQPVDVTTSSSGQFRGGALDTDVPDQYLLSYSATNKDGYSASAGRTVIVYGTGDLITDLSGLYTSTVVRDGSGGPQYTDMKYILIWKNSDGTFQLSDGIGGYYDLGRGYGKAYIAPGAKVTVNGLNDYTFGPNFTVSTFGGVAMMTSMTVDPVAKTIDFTSDWDAGPYSFAVHLEQVQ
ncbi:DUF5012 domain-containing protein [Flavobacteriaceae bacterium F89]|jgi:hypothetical protein|uniref:DUF5012 domain-containing protein n=1 Tax=Cerina litoralis TaxID=2874477 RepID=A0AAE3EZP9_9FLAO|nr:BT_2262 family domain-containing protein [Cerina litoralis]MCG2462637.1 DUF5012 domain-containing protein [Cerina litoralis]